MVIRSEGGTLDCRTSLYLTHKDNLFSRDDSTELMTLHLKLAPKLVDAPGGGAARPPGLIHLGVLDQVTPQH